MEKAVKEELKSTPQTLRLLEFKKVEIKSFAGIQTSGSLVIVPPKNTSAVGFQGDNGVGKTSAISAIATLLGGQEPANSENAVDKTKNAELSFTKNGVTYTVKQTKSTFSVIQEEKDGSKSRKESPKDFLRKLIGNVELSPMDIKNKSGEKQIEWLKERIGFTREQVELEKKIKLFRKNLYDNRTVVNNEAKRVKAELINTPYFKWSEEHREIEATDELLKFYEKTHAYPDNAEEVQANLERAKQKEANYQKGVVTLEAVVKEKDACVNEIAELERKLLLAKTKLTTLEDRIEKGNEFLRTNENAPAEYTAALKQWQHFSEMQNEKNMLAGLDAKFGVFKNKTEESANLTLQIEGTDKEIREMTKALTPDIPEFEVEIDDSIDAKRPVGIYYKNKPLNELCETDMFDWWFKWLAIQGTSVVVVENLPSLGSNVIKTLNEFIDAGGFVWYTAMERGVENIKVEFHNKLK